ncbi:calcineurin-like phosphoesterase C-terminal domain-containing protein [Myroides sp. NP-2]|uniref:calcineurin-like phosphoesterase C-terminal domain-containing protein n=1 Tax=Myroides sp. NP-2 TaxID=2759945 RepID=UPI0015FBCA47|nr:calcineurin-like phosphoesterase family protein [Myroides sp. NP-2]MBB1150217.1 calcineurin-like phosphoesterase C-terminal domain-containing protein [Myroides sp. NP-2]
MKKIILSIAFLFSLAVGAQDKVIGYVYEDVNANGKKDKKDRPIAEVAVSNGTTVVLTDEQGKYELPLSDDNPIFVIKPTGYRFALDEYNLPKYYYMHKPKGAPKHLKYSGIAPTGKLPKEVNFGLLPQTEYNDFKAFVFGDPQPYTMEEMDYYKRAIVDEAKQHTAGISFGISLGDIVGDDLSLHQPYKEVMKEINLPWYNVLGNHDMNYDVEEDRYSDETFERNFGPANYAFNYGNAHFIVLDDILYPHPVTKKGYWGGFRKDQLDFVRNNLKFVEKDRLIVVAFHIPLYVGDEKHFDAQARQELLDALADFDHVLLLSAHMHMQTHQFYGKEHGWNKDQLLHEYNVGTTSGDWYSGEYNEDNLPVSTMRDGTPKGYAILSVKNNAYVLDYKVAGKPDDYRMEVFMPQVVADKKGGNSFVYANVFMGTEFDVVEYRFDQQEWKKMKREVTLDPALYAKVQKYDLSDTLLDGKRPSNPVNSPHLWSARIPANLSVGTHQVEIRTKDMFERVFSTVKTFRVESRTSK